MRLVRETVTDYDEDGKPVEYGALRLYVGNRKKPLPVSSYKGRLGVFYQEPEVRYPWDPPIDRDAPTTLRNMVRRDGLRWSRVEILAPTDWRPMRILDQDVKGRIHRAFVPIDPPRPEPAPKGE